MWGKRVSVFECNPLGAGEIGGGDDPRTLAEFGEGFVSNFEGEKNGGGFEGHEGEHFAPDFEDQIIAPLDLLGRMGKTEANLSDGFDGVYSHNS